MNVITRIFDSISSVQSPAKALVIKDKIFNILRERSIMTTSYYGAMIAASRHDPPKAIHYFDEIERDGMQLLRASYTLIIPFSETAEIAKGVLDRMIADGITPDCKAYSQVILSIAKSEGVKCAIEYFEEQVKAGSFTPHRATYCIIMRLLASRSWSGDEELAIHYFQQMLDDGLHAHIESYNSLLTNFAISGNIARFDEFTDHMNASGISADRETDRLKIKALSTSGNMARVHELLDEIMVSPRPLDGESYFSAMVALMKFGFHKGALEVFERLSKDSRIQAKFVHYVYALRAQIAINRLSSSGSEKNGGFVLALFESLMADLPKSLSITQYGMLVNLAGNIPSRKHLHEIFAIPLPVSPGIKVYNQIIDALSRTKSPIEALNVWNCLIGDYNRKQPKIPIIIPKLSPSVVTICVALDACRHGYGTLPSAKSNALNIWAWAQSSNIELTSNCLTSLVECLIAFGLPKQAVDGILAGLEGEGLPIKCVIPDEKTIMLARAMLANRKHKGELARLNIALSAYNV